MAKMDGLPASLASRADRGVSKASALFRFHRLDEAVGKLDSTLALIDGPRGERLKDLARTELSKSLRVLRSCLAATAPTDMTTIEIRVFDEDGTDQGGPGKPAGEGVYVDVEGIRIGRTGPDGTIRAEVPSGPIRIRATEYPSSVGEEVVTVPPAASPAVTVVLNEGKEPTEDSDLRLEEAADDILPASPASITLIFEQDDQPVKIARIEDIRVSDGAGDYGEDFEQFFTIADGVMRATDVAAVYGRIAARSRIGRQLSLVADAIDAEGRAHYGEVRFHVGQFKLAVTLAPPPSNPALPVSNISVRVTVVGSDVSIVRISDAEGRFEIDSLPDATLAFDAHTMASGVHYYANATLTLCADRSVTVLMLNVKDLVAGVREVIQSGTPACPPVPRR